MKKIGLLIFVMLGVLSLSSCKSKDDDDDYNGMLSIKIDSELSGSTLENMDSYVADLTDSVGLAIVPASALSSQTTTSNDDIADLVKLGYRNLSDEDSDNVLVSMDTQGEIAEVEFDTTDGTSVDLDANPLALEVYGDYTVVIFEVECEWMNDNNNWYDKIWTAYEGGGVYIIHNETGKMFATKDIEEITENWDDGPQYEMISYVATLNEPLLDQDGLPILDEDGNEIIVTEEYAPFTTDSDGNKVYEEEFKIDVEVEFTNDDGSNSYTYYQYTDNALSNFASKFICKVQNSNSYWYYENTTVFAWDSIYAYEGNLFYMDEGYDTQDQKRSIQKISFDSATEELVLESYLDLDKAGFDMEVHFDTATGNIISKPYGEKISVFTIDNGLIDIDDTENYDLKRWINNEIVFTKYATWDETGGTTGQIYRLDDDGEFVEILLYSETENENAINDLIYSLDNWGDNEILQISDTQFFVKMASWCGYGTENYNLIFTWDEVYNRYEVYYTTLSDIEEIAAYKDGEFAAIAGDGQELITFSFDNCVETSGVLDFTEVDVLGELNVREIISISSNYDGTVYFTGTDNNLNDVTGILDLDGEITTDTTIVESEIIRIKPIN